jgi:DnaK suppressor protein
MIAIAIEPYHARLKKRRSEILKTLEHVQKEQREIEENKDWVDRAAYLSRCRLLDSLVDWYNNETARIDNALLRINEGSFGVCLACHEPIPTQRLETAPEAVFCAECQGLREMVHP